MEMLGPSSTPGCAPLGCPGQRKVAALLVQAMVNTKDEGTRYFMVRALSAVAVYLGAQDAEKVATLFLEEVTKPLGGSSGSRYPGMDLFLFSTVASRLKSKSPQVALQIIRAMGKTTNPTAMGILAGAFTSVAGDLEVKEAKEGVGLLMQIVSKTTDMEVVPDLVRALIAVGQHLEKADAGKVLVLLIKAIRMKIDEGNGRILGDAMNAIGSKLETKEAGKIAAMLKQIMDETTDRGGLFHLSRASSALADRLEKQESSQFCAGVAKLLIERTNLEDDGLG